MNAPKYLCEVTPEEKQFLYTGVTVHMLDTMIETEDSTIPMCCAEMFIGKAECSPGERVHCLICGMIWELDGLRWRMLVVD